MPDLPNTPQSNVEEYLAVQAGLEGNPPAIPGSRVEQYLAKILENHYDIPTKTSDLINDSGFQTLEEVTAAIRVELAGIVQVEWMVVQALPSFGEMGVIYLVPNSGTGTNVHDEYLWVSTTSSFEKIGTTDVDLTGYAKTADVNASLSAKQDKVTGKGLSTNDYTTEEKTKLGGVEAGAQVNPGPATSSTNGLMTGEDKAKLDSVSLPVILANQSVATFDGAAAGRPLRVIANIQPVQAAGTPSPSNPLPIAGWTGVNMMRMGKNLVFKEISNALVYTNGVFTTHESAKVAVAKVLAGYTYAFNVNIPGQNFVSVGFFYNTPARGDNTYNRSRTDTTSGTFTAPISGYAVINIASTVTDPIQVEYGATSTSYAAPETPVAISFPSSAGTVYGGTLDVARGLLTVTHGYRNVTSLPDEYTSVAEGGIGGSLRITEMKSSSGVNGKCNMLTPSVSLSSAINICAFGIANNRLYAVFSKSDVGETFQGLNNWLAQNPLQIVFPLAVPVTYQLTPQQLVTLAGTNNAFADCGPVTVTHWPGTGTPVEPVEDSSEIEWKKGILDRIAALEGG